MKLSLDQRKRITANLLEKYEKVAAGEPGQFRYPTGVAGLRGLGYRQEWYAHLPESAWACFCGVGNPFAPGLPDTGARVLDVGAGCGVDTLIAAGRVGPGGLAVGVESSPAMAARAGENIRNARAVNARCVQGLASALPFVDAGFDLVISSGVYNLVMDKEEALAEAYRVLRPGGRLQVADQMLTGSEPLSEAEAVASWFT